MLFVSPATPPSRGGDRSWHLHYHYLAHLLRNATDEVISCDEIHCASLFMKLTANRLKENKTSIYDRNVVVRLMSVEGAVCVHANL